MAASGNISCFLRNVRLLLKDINVGVLAKENVHIKIYWWQNRPLVQRCKHSVNNAHSASTVESEVEPEVESEVEPEVEREVKREVEPVVEPEVEPKVKPEVEPEAKPEVESEVEPEAMKQGALK